MGGRGFRDLHLFNIALLGKVGWRLVTDHTSLVARVFKARYFPNTNFLEANLGRNPSYVWSSIVAAQDLIKCGQRWKIGRGEDVRIWGQPWIADDNNFFVRSPALEGLEDAVVADLLIPETRSWNRVLIEGVFSQEDAMRILRTPISPSAIEDKIMWHFSVDGKYTVKTAYKLAAMITRNRELEEDGNWRVLWNLNIPPKVKDCMWRACRNCLPNRVNLFKKSGGQ